MIQTKRDLKYYIFEDYKVFGMRYPVVARFTYGENWELFSYMRNLRYLEFYTNKPKKNPWDKLMKAYHWIVYRRQSKKLDICVPPNTVGPGFHLQHRGFRHLNSNTRIGTNCEMLPLVLTGNKLPEYHGSEILIGDNCYISTGVTILGPVTIGNNVTIAAGAVVTKNVPDNCIVGGVPAKILKYK